MLGTSSPGHSISDNTEKLIRKSKGWGWGWGVWQGVVPGYTGVFATKDQVVGTSKDYC